MVELYETTKEQGTERSVPVSRLVGDGTRLRYATGCAVEFKRSGIGVAVAPGSVEARVDRAIGSDRGIVAGVSDRHLAATLRGDTIPHCVTCWPAEKVKTRLCQALIFNYLRWNM